VVTDGAWRGQASGVGRILTTRRWCGAYEEQRPGPDQRHPEAHHRRGAHVAWSDASYPSAARWSRGAGLGGLFYRLIKGIYPAHAGASRGHKAGDGPEIQWRCLAATPPLPQSRLAELFSMQLRRGLGGATACGERVVEMEGDGRAHAQPAWR
jgi:hypothetical protein